MLVQQEEVSVRNCQVRLLGGSLDICLPSTKQDLTQGQWPKGRITVGIRGGEGQTRAEVLLYSYEQLYICRCMQNHNNDTIKTSDTEKYTSHFIERVMCERELEAEQNCNTLTPHSYGHISVSFLFSWAAQPRAWGSSLSGTWSSFQHLLSNWLNFQCTKLYNNLTPTLLASVTISHSIQPVHGQGYILIFLDRMRLLFTQVPFPFWQLGWGQYVTVRALLEFAGHRPT